MAIRASENKVLIFFHVDDETLTVKNENKIVLLFWKFYNCMYSINRTKVQLTAHNLNVVSSLPMVWNTLK